MTPREIETFASNLDAMLIRWDRKHINKKGYNKYALNIYLSRADEVIDRMVAGATAKDALEWGYNDRLLAFLKKELIK